MVGPVVERGAEQLEEWQGVLDPFHGVGNVVEPFDEMAYRVHTCTLDRAGDRRWYDHGFVPKWSSDHD
jgi:hypothetical protein